MKCRVDQAAVVEGRDGRAQVARHNLRSVQGSGFRVQGSGFWVQGSGSRVQGSGFRVQGSGFRVQGSGFRVQGCILAGGAVVEGRDGRAQVARHHLRCIQVLAISNTRARRNRCNNDF